MKVKVLFIVSTAAVLIIGWYIFSLYNQEFTLDRGDTFEKQFTIWTTTSAVREAVTRFEAADERVRVNVRMYDDSEALLEDWEVRRDTEEAPDVIELNAQYGFSDLEEPDVTPIDAIGVDEHFHKSIYDAFSLNDILYAVPLGIEIPVVYSNASLVGGTKGLEPFYFNDLHTNEQLAELQQGVNERNSSGTFHAFQTDRELPWYWTSWNEGESDRPAEVWWEEIVQDYELIPPLDHHMALTRFVNREAGLLLSSSRHQTTLLSLIRNQFDLQVTPFQGTEGSPILIGGNGLAVVGSDKEKQEVISEFIAFLFTEEEQVALLSETGWLPSKEKQLLDRSFLMKLPMGGNLVELAGYEHLYTGDAESRLTFERWTELMERAREIERNTSER
ncbi:carbohydrate ABC transporter substrate-binding protein [Bacillus sp. H-16]|uniref:ABC transporter substrate-binding protein n=1 Tax=Alteribacter salitolerans TaxID=2912333 RepID=UPI0019660B5F|nr:ABC transporter substrate-binding protein [Alteribacter salitolerans]MBM7095695.1 carbohydrate ABC transporter substrate-binding protein [Alteribacter salitolerans]